MSKDHKGKKYNPIDRSRALGVYLACLNYKETSRITGLAPNTIKNIVNEEKEKNPLNLAKACTNLYKKNNKLIEQKLEEVQEAQFLSASYNYMENPYKLNQYMNLQDRQLISRTKLLYEAKKEAIAYELLRIERALFLRDLKQLTQLLKDAEKETKNLEPIDLEFLETPVFYGRNNKEKFLTNSKKEEYIKTIEDYLKAKGYDLTNIDLKEFIADKKEAFNYYYY